MDNEFSKMQFYYNIDYIIGTSLYSTIFETESMRAQESKGTMKLGVLLLNLGQTLIEKSHPDNDLLYVNIQVAQRRWRT